MIVLILSEFAGNVLDLAISHDFQCRQTKAVPGDRIDNDCDGQIDEETKNGKDDDGDKYVDEDLELVLVPVMRQLDY